MKLRGGVCITGCFWSRKCYYVRLVMSLEKAFEGYTLLRVHLTPRSGRDVFVRYAEEKLYVRVKAPPVDGEANKALLTLLAKALDLPKNHLELIAGSTSREKLVRIRGLDGAKVIEKLQWKLEEPIK